jgi:beta-lactamase regulating signal transducer with metallopeptidase domain
MSFAVSILVKATATLALALAVTRFAPRTRAAARHVLLAAAFGILLVLPIASMLAPPLRITLPIPLQRGANAAVADSMFTIFVESALAPVSRTPPSPGVSRTDHRSLLAPTALALWSAGALLFLGRCLLGLRQTRTLRTNARPWHRAQSMADAEVRDVGMRRVEVLRHDSITGPMTCGVLRPAVLLPTDACSWSDDDLHRAIVHELAHVRRRDWLTQSIARATAACYWFHPLVWLAWRRFALEAERACDDAVLERAEAAAHADQLVILAQRILDRPSASALAMASRSDLPSRVRALLDSSQRRGPAGAAWIATAALVSTMLVASMAALQIVAAQRADDEPSQMFDVATVKPCKDDSSAGDQRRSEWRMPSPGRLSLECVTLERLMYYAYAGLGSGKSPLRNTHPLTANLVRGGPRWIRSDRFNIEAKADGAADRAAMMGPAARTARGSFSVENAPRDRRGRTVCVDGGEGRTEDQTDRRRWLHTARGDA